MSGSKIKATATTTKMMALINASAYRPIGRYRRSKYKKTLKLAHRIQTRSSQYVASPPWTKQVCHGYGEPHGDTHGYGYVDRNSVPTAALERSNDVHRKHLKYFEPIRRAVACIDPQAAVTSRGAECFCSQAVKQPNFFGLMVSRRK